MRGNTNTPDLDFERLPRPLAEDLPPEAAVAAMHHYETRRNPEGLFRSAWNYTEFGLNRNFECSELVRKYYFEHAQNLIGMTLSHRRSHQDVKLGSLVLSSYIPLFQKRSFEQEVTPNDCRQVYESLGAAMRYLQPLETDSPPQWRMAETAVLALSARTSQPELLLYPTSPREETSSDAQFNHDSYFYGDGGKVPIQQKLIKTQKAYDEWITILTLQPLVEKGLKRATNMEMETLADQINYLLSLIVAETAGCSLERHERQFLNYLSQAVVSHRSRAAEFSRKAA